MGAVAILMDAVKSEADVRTTTNRKKPWTSKPWRGGMPTAEVMRKEKVNWRIIKMIQKSELTQVPVEQRVPGRVYGVSDSLDEKLVRVAIFKSDNKSMVLNTWKYWFALPESMLPVREVIPDQIKLDLNDWSYSYSNSVILLHRKKTRPELTIPSGTKSEQIEMLEKKLAELKQS
jgi:hypothetical protein